MNRRTFITSVIAAGVALVLPVRKATGVTIENVRDLLNGTIGHMPTGIPATVCQRMEDDFWMRGTSWTRIPGGYINLTDTMKEKLNEILDETP